MGETEKKTVKLYTRQNDKTLYQLERDGRVINQRAYVELHFGDIAPLFMESYDWFTREAAKRVPKPEDVKAPIWCSISVENCLKPELSEADSGNCGVCAGGSGVPGDLF